MSREPGRSSTPRRKASPLAGGSDLRWRKYLFTVVAVVALRQPRRVQRRNSSDRSDCGKPLRRWTRRYSSQRDEFYHRKQILAQITAPEGRRAPYPTSGAEGNAGGPL